MTAWLNECNKHLNVTISATALDHMTLRFNCCNIDDIDVAMICALVSVFIPTFVEMRRQCMQRLLTLQY